MILKVKKLNDKAVLPNYAHAGDAGLDLTVAGITTEVSPDGNLVYVFHSGLAVEIPEGYVGLLFQRSSVVNKSISLTNAVGVIDSGYRGEIMAKFKANVNILPAIYNYGEKFAQLIIMPIANVKIEETETLSGSTRGENGYGSTDEVDPTSSTDTNVCDDSSCTPYSQEELQDMQLREPVLKAKTMNDEDTGNSNS